VPGDPGYQPHRVPVTLFDSLASGAARYDGVLRSGQVSKRVLRILTMLRDVLANFPERAASRHFAAAYELLAAVRVRSPASCDAVLGDPQVGAWAAHALRRVLHPDADADGLDDDLGHLGGIAAAAACTAGHEFAVTLRVRADRTVAIPTFGVAHVPFPRSWQPAVTDSGAATIRLGGAHLVSVRDPVGGPGWAPTRRLVSVAGGRRIEVLLDDVDPYRGHGLDAAGRLPDAEVAHWQAALDRAWALLTSRHPARADALAAGLTSLVPLAPRERAVGRSASSGEACGAIALSRPADSRALAGTLVHEFQHSTLSALLDLVPLHRSTVRADRYAPWRADPRPLPLLLHGAYAFLGLVDFWEVERQAETGAYGRVAQFEFARWRDAVRRTLSELSASHRLTAAGDRFVAGMRRRLAWLRGRPVPAGPALLAREALLDHWIRWRLHNLRPDPAEVERCADAWTSGRARPLLRTRTDTVRGGPWPSGNPRLALAYHRLRGEPPGDAPAADLAYAAGEYRVASRRYQLAVATAPADTDAWAGLVLTHRHLRGPTDRVLLAHPEFVAALHRSLAAPDLPALLGWLTRG
jgi:HEXXH motif-containing protein